jgi:transaldolase/glucose-6-phosphate isomerase
MEESGMNPVRELQKHGQSVWLDYIRRSLLTTGELRRLMEEDGLRGVTSNPSIFEKAITGSEEYTESLRRLTRTDPHADGKSLFEGLAIEDIRLAADVLKPVYAETQGVDGYVSLEVSPRLAHDTQGTILEARRLWEVVDRPNLMIKVPATPEGIPAVETLIGLGINVNVTLMFSLAHYEAVAAAYIRGLSRAPDPSHVASVASFFVSRVDRAVDRALEEIGTPEALALRGRAAIANSKQAYRRFREIFYGEEFAELRARGALAQRPLWASTSTKNPAYSDVLYVEELIGSDTVNTVPPGTLNAFRDHGQVRASLEDDSEISGSDLEKIGGVGVDLDSITEELQRNGVKAFADSFEHLLASLEEKREAIRTHRIAAGQAMTLGALQVPVDERIREWEERDFARRFWCKDPSLWSAEPAPELSDRLGWLELPEAMHEELDRLHALAQEAREEGIRFVVVLGMGGSSLAPEVFQATFGNAPGFPELIVLDSTHPDAVRALEERIDLTATLFLVSSKSGTTAETLSFFRYFWKRAEGLVDHPGRSFIAITDPGTPLEDLARERGFRAVFSAPPDVGGRYSALTFFGMVPAALIGMDAHRFLDRAWTLSEGCADTGILPVADEPPGDPDEYGSDRVFVAFLLDGDDAGEPGEGFLDGLAAQGHPVIRVSLEDRYDLAREIFRWEMGVAAAGAVLDIHPFNQPDVELAKRLAREAMAERDGGSGGGAPESFAADGSEETSRALQELLGEAREGDYVAIQAYIAPTSEAESRLQTIRKALRDRLRLATTHGFGPRYLHSTGQLHKGGPNTGLFVQLVDQPSEDLPVPETDYTFADLIQAQARGDYQALRQRGRRVIRLDLGRDPVEGLDRLIEELA